MTLTMTSSISGHVVHQLIAKAQNDDVQKLAVGAVIRRDGRSLLLERIQSDFMGGLVELPSGTVDAGETILTALARETGEETGLTITAILAYLGFFDYPSGSGKKTRQFNFFVAVAPGKVKLNPTEHHGYHLITSSDEEFSTLNISDAVKSLVVAAEKQPVERRGPP